MNWARVIDRNREALLRVVADLSAMAGLTTGPGPDPETGEAPSLPARMPRHRFNSIRRILRAAESAVRRLVVIAARRFAVIPLPAGAFMYGLDPDKAHHRRALAAGSAKDGGDARIPPFVLTDPVKTFSLRPPKRRPKAFPRITCLGNDPTPVPEGWYRLPGDEIDAGPLCRRLISLRRALDDIDGQARRLVRWQARRDRAGASPARRSPLRIGRPPGRRKRPVHEVDEILNDVHALARYAMVAPDTS